MVLLSKKATRTCMCCGLTFDKCKTVKRRVDIIEKKIANIIKSERYNKHGKLDWEIIAAKKIYHKFINYIR